MSSDPTLECPETLPVDALGVVRLGCTDEGAAPDRVFDDGARG